MSTASPLPGFSTSKPCRKSKEPRRRSNVKSEYRICCVFIILFIYVRRGEGIHGSFTECLCRSGAAHAQSHCLCRACSPRKFVVRMKLMYLTPVNFVSTSQNNYLTLRKVCIKGKNGIQWNSTKDSLQPIFLSVVAYSYLLLSNVPPDQNLQ